MSAAVAAFGAGVGVAIKSMASYSAALVEASRTTGLAVKELESMRSLLQGDGIGIKRTDKAMQEFNVRVGFAQRGIGQYTRAFDRLGIEMRKGDGTFKSQQELLTEVADRLQKTESGAEAASLAYELFGRAGKEVLPILQRYGSDLDTAAKKANRFRTVTEDQHKANKALDQAFTDLSENLKDLRDRVLSTFSESLGNMIENFNRWLSGLKSNKGAIESLADSLLRVADSMATVAAIAAGGALGAKMGRFLGPKGAIGGMVAGGIAGFFMKEMASSAIADAALSGPQKALRDVDSDIARMHRAKNEDFDSWRPQDESELQDAYRQRRVLVKMIADLAAATKSAADVTRQSTRATGTLIKETDAAADAIKQSKTLYQDRQKSARTRGEYYAAPSADSPRVMGDLFTNPALRTIPADDWSGIGQALGAQRVRRDAAEQDLRVARALAGPIAELHAAQRRFIRAVDRLPVRVPNAPNYGIGRVSRGESSGAIGGFPSDDPKPVVASYSRNAGWSGAIARRPGDSASGVHSAAWFAAGGRGRDPFLDDLALDRLRRANSLWRSLRGAVDSTYESRIAGARATRKAEQALYDQTKRDAEDAQQSLRDFWNESLARAESGQAARAAGAVAKRRGAALGSGDVKETAKETESLTTGAMEARQAFMHLGDSIVGNFANAKDALKSFARELVNIGIRRMLLNPLATGLFGAADGSTTGLFGGIFNSFADGGLAGRGMALVGERGPEIVDFAQPGRVYTTKELGAAMGGGRGVTIQYNISSTDGPGVRAALAEATPRIVHAAVAQTRDDASRYGSARRQIRGTA